jgi:glycosyltransferase involved in cell wall biosynthesis
MLVSRVLSGVDCLLPNSSAELKVLEGDYAAVFKKRKKYFVIVPNGVDASIFCDASPEGFERKYGLRDFILNVGRFSYRKNQLSLIRALKGLDLQVVFIGGSDDSSDYYGMKDAIDKAYYQKCEREADSSFEFLPSMTQEELASAYSACKAFVLPSFYETPGLSALEAALAGANLCVTCGGSTYEYFSDLAFYVDPFDLGSIKRGVLKAFQANKGEALKRHVLLNFTWEKAAQATLRAYKEVLEDD